MKSRNPNARSNDTGASSAKSRARPDSQRSKPRSQARGQISETALPLQYWYRGLERRNTEGDHNWWLVLQASGRLVVQSRSPESQLSKESFEFECDREIVHIEYCEGPKVPFISMQTLPSDQQRKTPGKFVPGSQNWVGRLVFVIEERHPNTTEFNAMIRKLGSFFEKRSVCRINFVTVKSMLEAIQATAERSKPPPGLESDNLGGSNHRAQSASRKASGLETEELDSETPRLVPPEAKRQPKTYSSDRARAGGSAAAQLTPLRRSTRHSLPNGRQTPTPAVDPEEIILVYPLNGTGAGKVTITRGDVSRLKPGEFLNDTLIEFGLKFWLNELRAKDPDLADQVHVFSSFFFKKLDNRRAEDGYSSIRKWTSKVDIFKKKYIIVPINENFHWYLAIIYQPEYILSPPPPTPQKVVTRAQKRKSDALEVETETSITTDSPEIEIEKPEQTDDKDESKHQRSESNHSQSTQSTQLASEQDVQELLGSMSFSESRPDASPMEDQQDSLPQSPLETPGMELDKPEAEEAPGPVNNDGSTISPVSFYGKGLKRKAPPSEEETQTNVTTSANTEHPTTSIFIFDSLRSAHPKAVRILSRYLELEARDKKQIENTSKPRAQVAQVPVQPNSCDCGVYLLHFAKTFMEDPERFAALIWAPKKSITYKDSSEHWQGEAVSTMREEYIAKIEALSEEWRRIKDEDAKRRGETTGEDKRSGGDGETVDSDSDIEIEEVKTVEEARPSNSRKPRHRARRTGGAPKQREQPVQQEATRLRG
ncbi:hypothetical protein PUNSTDRAFT_97302 [Punctularia strigosozonata HHB-11173 SS5]|uniref:uncharacterized protein n=1 Tax=Punctularia strigosozonata (strain HHB-11173) TaxID=741275 RepID=UPI0004418442|nr:uncharacterized protein PUNSTDRAFT_97302 [Punctularia strigosozonata HHB-11173 SS5]EIN12536.1 hypothetical protein PUNSTDRAFT_97302 [Punctularia strigosozonata HHB-11173 SS5]